MDNFATVCGNTIMQGIDIRASIRRKGDDIDTFCWVLAKTHNVMLRGTLGLEIGHSIRRRDRLKTPLVHIKGALSLKIRRRIANIADLCDTAHRKLSFS